MGSLKGKVQGHLREGLGMVEPANVFGGRESIISACMPSRVVPCDLDVSHADKPFSSISFLTNTNAYRHSLKEANWWHILHN